MEGSVDNRRMYIYLLVLTVLSATGLQSWRTLINNFAVEAAHLEGDQMGWVQSLREVPGFLSLLVVYLLLVLSEHRLAALSILVMGIGVGLTGFFRSFWGVVGTTLLMSFGFHYYETLNQSLTLQYFDKARAPVVFGKLRAAAAATNIAVGAAIFVAASFLSYRTQFLIWGGLLALGSLWALAQDPSDRNLVPQRKEMVFRRRYWLFYALTFLSGARRQIFVAFAVFLLVKKFHYSLQAVTVLFVINNVINTMLSPAIGRAVARYGERKVLSVEYAAITAVFIGYALTRDPLVAGALYVIDHIFFNFAIAIRTYFQKMADPQDIAPSMAVGFTINHIAAVVIPALGGLLWMVDYRIPFVGGAVLSLFSLAMTQCIKTAKAPRA
ncbi:Major Facilitator Superfamily protein [Desulfacinum infernum DSM 9756]|uniref:Major Facilitator Superfamily protein n=1 Tax=Desulfacinum infernum DSM 9756 TaxID=1121391 RepID=A0A1M4YFW2_9BACT|nr:MFS transporter [Desulfacinum infernum]SHF04694.1 Major Facilitator Superfamily protein [Desulfacinum infernum DSM 9756]